MTSYLSNPWNNAVAYVEMMFGEQKLGTGSGFFWREGARTFLVSNWHNFAVRDPVTDTSLASHAGVPNELRFTGYVRVPEQDAGGLCAIQSKSFSVVLCDADLSNPRWYEHARRREGVDVAAIDITSIVSDNGIDIRYVNDLEQRPELEPVASQDVFIIGYPLGLVTQSVPIPVWKRGTVATDPSFDPDGLPKILVDTATRKGMSGSIALVRHRSATRLADAAGQTTGFSPREVDRILGIYSGRIGAHDIEAQLGIVWKRYVIAETIQQQVRPTV